MNQWRTAANVVSNEIRCVRTRARTQNSFPSFQVQNILKLSTDFFGVELKKSLNLRLTLQNDCIWRRKEVLSRFDAYFGLENLQTNSVVPCVGVQGTRNLQNFLELLRIFAQMWSFFNVTIVFCIPANFYFHIFDRFFLFCDLIWPDFLFRLNGFTVCTKNRAKTN